MPTLKNQPDVSNTIKTMHKLVLAIYCNFLEVKLQSNTPKRTNTR